MSAFLISSALSIIFLVVRDVRRDAQKHRGFLIAQRDAEITRLFSNPPSEMIAAMLEVDAMGLNGAPLAPMAHLNERIAAAVADRRAGVPIARRRDEVIADLVVSLGYCGALERTLSDDESRRAFEQANVSTSDPAERTFTSAGRTLPVPTGWRRDDALKGWHGPKGFLSDERIEFWSNGGRS